MRNPGLHLSTSSSSFLHNIFNNRKRSARRFTFLFATIKWRRYWWSMLMSSRELVCLIWFTQPRRILVQILNLEWRFLILLAWIQVVEIALAISTWLNLLSPISSNFILDPSLLRSLAMSFLVTTIFFLKTNERTWHVDVLAWI